MCCMPFFAIHSLNSALVKHVALSVTMVSSSPCSANSIRNCSIVTFDVEERTTIAEIHFDYESTATKIFLFSIGPA